MTKARPNGLKVEAHSRRPKGPLLPQVTQARSPQGQTWLQGDFSLTQLKSPRIVGYKKAV